MLMEISGKGEGKAKGAAKETKRPSRHRKAGPAWTPRHTFAVFASSEVDCRFFDKT
jgi:hypothetical protein